jgi:HEAT repeat protein
MSDRLDRHKAIFTPAQALRNLSDPDPAVRLNSAKWLAKQALAETSNAVEAWIANAHAMNPIIAALDDPDSKVAEQAIIAVAEFSRRYYKDGRAYPGVVRLLRSKRRFSRFWAVAAARWLRGKRCLDDVLPLLNDKAKHVRREVLRAITGLADGKLKPELRERLLEAVRPILHDVDARLRANAANALREIGDRSPLEDLKEALRKERDKLTRESLEMAIEGIEKKRVF